MPGRGFDVVRPVGLNPIVDIQSKTKRKNVSTEGSETLKVGMNTWSTILFLCSFRYHPRFLAVVRTSSMCKIFFISSSSLVPSVSALYWASSSKYVLRMIFAFFWMLYSPCHTSFRARLIYYRLLEPLSSILYWFLRHIILPLFVSPAAIAFLPFQ